MMETSLTKAHRVPSLDGLRAISILMVVYSHALIACGFPDVPAETKWVFNGSLGVKIFFVISGFIITSLLLKEERDRGRISLRRFYQRRILRIVPVYFIFLLVVLVLVTIYDLPVPVNDFLQAFTFTMGWSEASWMLGHTWSLAVEEQFYILWPLAFFLGKTAKIRIRLCLLALSALPIMRVLIYLSPLTDHRSFLIITQGDGLAAGCLLACLLFYYGDKWKELLVSYTVVARLVLVAIIAAIYVVQEQMMVGFLTVPFANTIEAICIVWIVGSLILKKDFLFSILNSPPMRFLGLISYSWYLWQQLFLFPCGRYFDSALFNFPFNVLASMIVAIASYYLVERTCEKLKRRWLIQ
jgi:peptidoglycan/LPS O-acetylase OafA/YrhL